MERPYQDASLPPAAGNAEQPKLVEFSNDPIIRAVQEHNIKWKANRDWRKLRMQQIGRISIYPVEFIGENNWQYTNYVCISGDKDDSPEVYENLGALFANMGSKVLPVWADIEVLKVYLIIIMAILLILASVLFALVERASSSLPLFVGLLGSIVGYLIGDKRPTK